MTYTFKERILKANKAALKRRSNRIMISFMAIFVLGYIFFFTSQIWLPPTYVGVPVTKVGNTINANDRQIKVASLDYSKDDRTLEVIMDIKNLSIDKIKSYNYRVKDKNGVLKSEVVLEEDGLVVLHIKKLKKRWTELAINIRLKPDDEEEYPNFEPIKIYVSDKICKNVSEIKERTTQDYIRYAKERQIEGHRGQIKELQNNIYKKKSDIKEIKAKIEELKKSKKIQTQVEKQDTDSSINDLTIKQNELELKIQEEEKNIDDLREKIKYLG